MIEREFQIVTIPQAVKLAGYKSRQTFMYRVASAGGLTIRRIGGDAAMFVFRDELLAWMAENPRMSGAGRQREAA